MKSEKISMCLLILISLLASAVCSTYFFGKQTNDTRLVHRDKVQYEAFPLKKRIKVWEYKAPSPIKAISCYDYQNSDASVNITSGGVGFKDVTLRLKSQRSYRLDYAIEVYA